MKFLERENKVKERCQKDSSDLINMLNEQIKIIDVV
jgi:hypothetical protein